MSSIHLLKRIKQQSQLQHLLTPEDQQLGFKIVLKYQPSSKRHALTYNYELRLHKQIILTVPRKQHFYKFEQYIQKYKEKLVIK